ncbi:MAG: transporter [Deltaproteobacteria bacterium]|nr:transporter [Deltaproteobacteria bacterium]
MDKKRRSERVHYGWYIVAASFMILCFNAGARYAFGVMFKPIIKEFGWGRGEVSLVFFVNMVIFAVSLLIVGKLYDRYGPKWVVIISTIFISTGFMLTSFIHSIGQFFFSYGILAAFGIAGTAVPLMATLTSKWFDKWRGFAVSLSVSGNSIGQFALVPLFSFFALNYGWRASYLYIGIIMLVVNILLAFFVIKGDPRHFGLKPYGFVEEKEGGDGRQPPVSSAGSSMDMGIKQAMRTSAFWFFAIVMFICGGGDYFATIHLIPLATDYGISPMTAGNMLALYGLMSLAGVLIAGPVADLMGSKIPIILTFVLRVLLFVMLIQYKNEVSFYVFAFAFGFTHLITAPLTPILIGRLYGFTYLGILTGFINTVHFLGAGFWPYMAGVIFDKTGSYQLVFILSAILAFVAVIAMLLVKERRYFAMAVVTREDQK